MKRQAKNIDASNTLLALGIGLVIVGIAVALGASVVSDVQTDFTAGTSEYNATMYTLDGLENLTEKFPIYATAGISIVLIGMFLVFMGRRR